MDSFPPQLLITIVFLLITMLVRFAQAAVDNVSEAKLTRLADEGDKRAEAALKRLEKNTRVYNCLKIVSVLAELCAAGTVTVMLSAVIAQKHMEAHGTLILFVGILVLSFIMQIFCVYIPRKATAKQAEKVLFAMMWLINTVCCICMPFEKMLYGISALILRPFGIGVTEKEDDEVTEEEIRFMVDVGSESGAIDPDEKEMIHNIFELDDTPVRDVITHRTDVEFLWKDDSIKDMEETISRTNHSIYPLCGESVDDIIGLIKATDFYKLLRNEQDCENIDIEPIIRSPYLVPETIKADDLFRHMQRSKNHFAIVLDEYGGLAGIITMSDLLEEIVGDLDNDTEAVEEVEIAQIDNNTWKILGSTDIETVSKELNIDLPVEEYNTFAGMILGSLGAIPEDGTTAEVEAYGLQIKVTKISDHRIDEALVCKIEQDKPEKDD